MEILKKKGEREREKKEERRGEERLRLALANPAGRRIFLGPPGRASEHVAEYIRVKESLDERQRTDESILSLSLKMTVERSKGTSSLAVGSTCFISTLCHLNFSPRSPREGRDPRGGGGGGGGNGTLRLPRTPQSGSRTFSAVRKCPTC